MLNSNQYSLILAAALFSIIINPFMYKLLPFLEKTLRLIPAFWRKLEANIPLPEIEEDHLVGHAVIVGYGQVGKHLVDVLESLSIPLLVMETDPERIVILNQRNIPTLYGDASNSEIIKHANLDHASILVITVPDETTTILIVTTVRDLNPDLSIIARAATAEGVRYF